MFEIAIKKILKNEGGYVNNPLDSGGETNYGISKKSYPDLDIKNLTMLQAKEIYKSDYWDRLRLDHIKNINISSSLFDFAVNVGSYQATKVIQKIVNTEINGIIGAKTIRAINNQNSLLLDLHFTLEKIIFYISLVEKNKRNLSFLIGWIKRAING